MVYYRRSRGPGLTIIAARQPQPADVVPLPSATARPRCTATRDDGTRCPRLAQPGTAWCRTHAVAAAR